MHIEVLKAASRKTRFLMSSDHEKIILNRLQPTKADKIYQILFVNVLLLMTQLADV